MLGIEGTRGVPFPLTCLQKTSKPRAVIIHNPSLDIWQIPHLSDSNFQTGIWRNTKHKMPIIIISAYWGIKLDNIPSTLKAAITEAKRKKYEILPGIDTNAHHPAWGSPGINQRGTLFENLITAQNLQIFNTGDSPTFIRANCATHIDLTITTKTFIPKIQHWEILTDDMLSDHLCLHTIIGQMASYKRQILNFETNQLGSIYINARPNRLAHTKL